MRVKRDRYEIHPVFGKECFEMIDWIIGIVIAAAVVAVIVKKVKDKKAGKSGCGCGCGCGGCASKGQCH